MFIALILCNLLLFAPIGGVPFYSLADTPIFDRVVDARMFRYGNWVFSSNNLMTQVIMKY